MARHRRRPWLPALALVLAVGARQAAAKPQAQSPVVVWSEPRVVWETAGRTSNPILVTDAWGRVHLFFLSQEEGEAQNTLFYVEAANEDARPVDVQVGVNEYRVAADPYGSLHVLSLGANDLMHYTRVPATEAGRAGAWAPPANLGNASLGSDIVADDQGNLHLCYPRDHAVYHQFSADGGATWGDPRHVADMVDPSGVATYVRCAVDTTATLHLAWAEARPPNFYPPDGVFYTRGAVRDAAWAAPEQLAGLHYTLPGLLADPRGLVHLLYQGDVAVGGRYYLQRPAGVEGRWGSAETVVPAGRGGMSGDSFLALDSRGDLHAGLNIDGIYWSVRRSAWSAPLDLSAPLRSAAEGEPSMEQASLAIANGNEVFVGFEKGFKRIYLLRGQTDAPEALPTPIRVATNSVGASSVSATAHRGPVETAGVAVRATPSADRARLAQAAQDAAQSGKHRLPLAVGSLLAGLAILLPLLRRRRRSR